MKEWTQETQAVFWILLSALMLYNPIRIYAKWIGNKIGWKRNGSVQWRLLILAYLIWYLPVVFAFLGMLFDKFRYVLLTCSFSLLWVVAGHIGVILWSKNTCKTGGDSK